MQAAPRECLKSQICTIDWHGLRLHKYICANYICINQYKGSIIKPMFKHKVLRNVAYKA